MQDFFTFERNLAKCPDIMVRWRENGGGRLTTVDVRKFEGESIVVHFGGQLTSVDAYTFANSLISFADTVRLINAQINPSQDIDVRLDAVGPGSFKAVIKQVKKGLASLFTSAPQNVFWIIAALYIENSLEGTSTITVSRDTVTIQRGDERIIIPKDAFDGYKRIMEDTEVHQQVSRTFEAVERDEAIENFGLSPSLEDAEPLVQIPRKDFGALIRMPDVLRPDEEKRRPRTHSATLIVLKPWINASEKKWSFEWNGVPVSAYVQDENFLQKVRSHQIRFGNGDALEVDMGVYEELDESRGVWINDKSSYVIKAVHKFLPIGQEKGLLC